MLKRTRIAVISDLHIGTEAVSLDLCPHELDEEKKVGLQTDFISVFKNYVKTDEFKKGGPIDLLCVTGDISNRASPIEFRRAHEVLMELASSLGIEHEQVYFVPGNHDVHWPVMKLEPKEFWDKFRYEPFLQENLIFKDRVDAAETGAFHTQPHFVAWNNDSRLIVGINSAAFDSPEPEHKKHHGLIPEATLIALEEYLASLTWSSSELRICLLHHHPILYSDPQPNIPDFSAATNAGKLFEILSKYQFDLVVHGHKHYPQLTHRAAVTNGHPVTVLGAGSLSAKLSSQWNGIAQNQFHVIDVEGRNVHTNGTFGFVATWNHVSGKWREGHSQLGLCATEGFGTLSTPHEIKSAITEKITAIFQDTNVQMCDWTLLSKQIPYLKHSKNSIVFEAMNEVAKDLGCDLYGDIDSKKAKWAIIRIKDGA